MRVEIRPIAALDPDARNPRQHGARQIRQIARSIEAFGFNVPVLIDREDRVIAGHGRLLACRQLGWSEVPTIRLDHLSEAQARAFTVADNRLTECSSWDDRLLGELLLELSTLDLEFNLEATGFAMGEIDLRIEGLTMSDETANPADELPPTGPAIACRGDLWLLGRHQLLCGDALDAANYATLMASMKASMVFTDPPYNVPIEGHVGGLGRTHHPDFAMACGEMSPAEFTAFLSRICTLLARHSEDGALHFLCMDWRHMAELLAAGSGAYTELKNLCVWAKSNAGMGSLYRSQHELVFVFKHGRAAHCNNIDLGRHGRHRSNLWSYPGISDFGRAGEEGNLRALHPTVKPVALVADALLDCSRRGEIVLDPFLGSGTTLLAAERTGRACRGLEIDPRYVDVAIRRWQVHTGEIARHSESGRSFDEVVTAGHGHVA